MQSAECAKLRREFINDIVNLLFEAGRHDRSKKWIWLHFIRPYMGIEYQSFLKETKYETEFDHKRLVKLVAKFELLTERAKQVLEKQHCRHLLPKSREVDDVLKHLEEI